MSETLRPETNKPVELAFKFLTGKECDSPYSGKQKLFTVVLPDGEVKQIYLSVAAGDRVEAQLAQQRINAGENVDFCKAEVKKGNSRGIEYQVKRVNPPATNTSSANGVHPPAPPAPATQQPVVTNGNGSASNGHMAPAPPVAPRTKLDDALCTVIAACHKGRLYAKEIGYEMPVFNGDEIVRMVNTLMIQNGNGHNGGVR